MLLFIFSLKFIHINEFSYYISIFCISFYNKLIDLVIIKLLYSLNDIIYKKINTKN